MSSLSQRIRSIALPIVAIALLAAACSKSGAQTGGSPTPLARPSSTGHIRIVSPKNGQVFHGSSVDIPVKVALTGAKIVPATTTHIVPDQGHLHVYLDNQIAGMNFQLDDVIPNVSPGTHILRVEFVASDHLPFDPRVFVEITFQVQS